MRRRVLFLAVTLTASAAYAQSGSDLTDRLSRIERDMNFLQRQVYNGGTGSAAATGGAAMTGQGAAQLQVQMSQIQEDIRALRGQIEQATYTANQAAAAQKKLQEDMHYRLQILEQAQAAAAVAAQAPAATTEPATTTDDPEEPAFDPTSEEPARYKPAHPKPAATGADFPDSNAAYNAAFKALNEKDYTTAAVGFDAFVRKYPKDPLVSNAYYWLGESYYARSDYTRATEGFRKGFESNPRGQKAPDNLLKLAMSLDKIKRSSEACIVLKQVISKYGESAPRTKSRAESESARMQCK